MRKEIMIRICLLFCTVLFASSFFAQMGVLSIELNRERIATEDKLLLESRGIEPIGRTFPFNYDLSNLGAYDIVMTDQGEKHIWIMDVSCEGSTGINFYFSHLNLEEDELILITSDELSEKIQLSGRDLSGKNNFATPHLPGDKVSIQFISNRMISELPFLISQIGCRYLPYESSIRGGGSCNVDISCSEADIWSEQIDAVMRILIAEGGVQFSCSGTLMNNTSGDQRRLVLSALHCMSESTAAELSNAVVTFNYQRPQCGSGFAPENNFLVGLTRLADSNDADPDEVNPSGSDFILVEIQDEIPSDWNPYWAGWNSLNVASSSGVTVHHPSGGAKKISTYNSTTVSTFLGGPGSHWGVNWISTANGHGVTEPGSSGAPLFNSNGLVMGTLTGGFSNCLVDGNFGPNGTDYFGKLSYHWNNNPNPASEKLKLWLDPLNTGVSSLEGSYNPQMSVSELSEWSSFHLYPNPTEKNMTLDFETNSEKTIFLIDGVGKEVKRISFYGNSQMISLENLPSGAYFIRIKEDNVIYKVERILKF